MKKHIGCGSTVMAVVMFAAMVVVCLVMLGCCQRVELVEEPEQIEMDTVNGYALNRL